MIPLMILGALMGLASIVGLLGLLWAEAELDQMVDRVKAGTTR